MKTTFVILVTSFLSLTTYAQPDFEPETYFGGKFGGIISRINADPGIEQQTNLGLTSGLVFKHISEKSLGIQIELNYNQSGWKEDLENPNTYQRSLNFLELPFMTHVNLGNQKTRFIINTGPYVSYLLSEEEDIELSEGFEESVYYGEEIDNKAQFGLCFGLGISRRTAVGVFQLESRISSGFTNLFKNTVESGISSSINLTAQLSLSYMLDHKIFGRSKS